MRGRTTRMNDHRNSQHTNVLSFGPFSLFAAERLLKKADEPIPLGDRALDVLIVLAEQNQRVRGDSFSSAVDSLSAAIRTVR